MRSSRASSGAWARSARNGAPVSTRRLRRNSFRLRAWAMWSIRQGCGRLAPGVSTAMRSVPASPNSGRTSIIAASTTAGISPSRGVPFAVLRPGPLTPTGCCRTSGSTRKSASLPGPAAGVAGGDLGHHLREGVIEIEALRVRDADYHEQNVCELHGNRTVGLARLLWLGAEAVIDLPRQLADFFGQARHVRERREVALFELPDPEIHRLLCVAETHGLL